MRDLCPRVCLPFPFAWFPREPVLTRPGAGAAKLLRAKPGLHNQAWTKRAGC